MSKPTPIYIPAGYRLVPITPTPEQIDAAGCGWVIKPSEESKRCRIYRAMVMAAPATVNGSDVFIVEDAP